MLNRRWDFLVGLAKVGLILGLVALLQNGGHVPIELMSPNPDYAAAVGDRDRAVHALQIIQPNAKIAFALPFPPYLASFWALS